jgi:iron complex transport system substrate-binding protein
MTGRPVTLAAPPRRIMPLTPVTWHYLAIEPDDKRFLKIPPYMRREIGLSPLKWVFPGLLDKPVAFLDNNSASGFSVEETMAQSPEAVLSWDYLSPAFERAKVRGLIKISADSGEKERLFKLLGQVTGKSGRVEWLLGRLERKKAELFAAAAACAAQGQIRPQGVLIIDDDNFSLGTGKYYSRFNFNAQRLGIKNLAEQPGFANGFLNVEELLKIDPEIIFINHYLLAFSTMTVDDVYKNPKLQGLRAVQNRRVYHMPKGAARLEGPLEEHLLAIWAFQAAHLNAPFSHGLREEIKMSYREIWGYGLSDGQVDEWLRLKENLASKGYARFMAPSAGPAAPAAGDLGKGSQDGRI